MGRPMTAERPSPDRSAAEWAALDRISRRVFRSSELAKTVDAVVDALVPAYANAAAVELLPDGGRASVALRARSARAVPLTDDGVRLGTLRLVGPRPPNAAFLDAAAARCAGAIANALRFEHERRGALTFQNAALACSLPPASAYRFDAVYQAGSAEALVGGDWYDAFELPDGRFVISIGDVAGGGLEAAVAMVNVRQTIRGVAQVHADPALMLEAAERTLRAQHPGRFVTAFVGVADPVTQTCSFAGAGHPSPFLRLPDGAVVHVGGGGLPLGIGLDAQFEVRHVSLPPGALFVLYTDGLTEATRDVLEGERRLESALRDTVLAGSDAPAHALRDAVLDAKARDDVAILAVRVSTPVPIRRWRFEPQSRDVTRRTARELREALEQIGARDEQVADAELVFAELIGNAVRYAPGIVELVLEPQCAAFVLHLLDTGPGFTFSPRLPHDLYCERGRGLFLIAAFATHFSVGPRAGGGSHARAGFSNGGRSGA